ncbi:MAG: tetratricopeptide repeat protein, partial [Halothece sp. Uz-M2-17]|nr:tetratricopeptide repeat protein [Halothece sp. Uz-M2-17]
MPATAQSQTTVSNLHQKAESALAQKQFQDAIALCRHILKAKSNFFPAYKTLGKALLASGDLEGAAKAFQQAIALEPNRPEAYANLGSVRAQQEQWQDAINCYQKAIEINPEFAGVYRNMARLWERLNKPESAAEAWERAYSLEPNKVKPQDRLRLGDDFSQLGQVEKAIACYQRAIEAKPDWGEAYQRLGNALEQAGRWQEATEVWKKAMMGRPSQETVVSNGQAQSLEADKEVCKTHIENQEWSEAIAVAKQALAIQEDAQIWHWLGKAQHATKQIQAAAHSYQKAIALQPLPESYANLGSLYASQKQWQKAISYYQQALKLDSQQAGIWRNLARTFDRAGDLKKAASAWYHAYSLEPNQETPEQHFQLGKTLEEYGQLTEAIACYQNTVVREPNWGLAHYRLGEALKKAERWEEATASLRRAIECQSQESVHAIVPEKQDENDAPVVENKGNATSKALLEKALETDDAETYIRLTQVYLEEKQAQRAIAAARQALAIQRDAMTYRWLGKALQAGKELQEAKQCYKTALSLQPQWADLQVDWGDWHGVQQQWRRAIGCYRKALKLDDSHVEAYRGLAHALEKLGQHAKAIEYRYYVLCQEEAT